MILFKILIYHYSNTKSYIPVIHNYMILVDEDISRARLYLNFDVIKL